MTVKRSGADEVKAIVQAAFPDYFEEAQDGEIGFAVKEGKRRLVIRMSQEFNDDWPHVCPDIKRTLAEIPALLRQSTSGCIRVWPNRFEEFIPKNHIQV